LLPELVAARHAFDFGPIVVVHGETDSSRRLYSYAECIERGDDRFDPVLRKRHEVALLLYTARVEGRPKGTAHLLDAPLAVADTYGRYALKLESQDVLSGVTPLGLVDGLVPFAVFSFRFGASVVLMPEFDPERLLAGVSRYGATVLTLTPTAYRQILASPVAGEARAALATVRLCLSSGEPLTRSTYEAWERLTGLPIFEGFATTEMLAPFLSNAVGQQARPGSLGQPVPGYEVAVVDDHGREVRRGDIGHLVVRGPTGTLYWNDPAAQANAVKDGWNRTGDYVYADADGYFWFVARQDDIIKSGGYRIDPAEVELALREHPMIADAAVIGMPDDLVGQAIHAILVPVSGQVAHDALAADVLESLRGRLASYKIPTAISFAAALPRDNSGHLLRRMLREQLRRIYQETGAP
jgi:2-aminobenzoate-CoA ligase